MRAWLGVVRFEVERSWLVLAAGLVAGLAALGAPAVYPAVESAPADVAGVAAFAAAATIVALASLALGARSLAGGVVTGLDELLLSWPVRAGTAWVARIVAVAGLTVTAATLALVPSALAYPSVAEGWLRVAHRAVPVAVACAVALAATGAVARGLLAARSAWIAGGLAGGVALWLTYTGVLIRAVFAALGSETGWTVWLPAALGATAAAVPLVAASAAGAAAGRAQLRRWAHAAGAVATVGLLAAAGALRLWAGAALSPRPADIERIVQGRGAPHASLALVGATARRAGLPTFAWFAVDPEDGRWDLLGLGSRTGAPVVVAPSGRFVVSNLVTPEWKAGRLAVLELAEGRHRTVAWVESLGVPLALSADGRLVLLRHSGLDGRRGTLEVLRVRDGSRDRELPEPGPGYVNAWISADGTVRVLVSEFEGGRTTRLVESPPGGRDWIELWRAPGYRLGFSEAGSEVLLRLEERDGVVPVSIRRLADGAELWRCETVAGEGGWEVRLVDAERLLEARSSSRRPAELVLHTPGGIAWTARLPLAATFVRWGGRPRHDAILVTARRGLGPPVTFAVDLRDGALHALGNGTAVLAGWKLGLAPPPLLVRGARELLRVTPDLRLEPVPVE